MSSTDDASSVRDRLLTDDHDERIADRRIKPSLLALLKDQAALLDAGHSIHGEEYDLRTGFPDRRALISWYQRATVRTLGHIEDDWPPIDCFAETADLLPALIRSDTPHITPMDPGKAVTYRQLLEATVVQPAFNRAYSDLKRYAREYVEDDGGDYGSAGPSDSDLAPGRQKNVMMRPGFQTLDKQQHEALEELWGGFPGRDAVLDWIHALNSPTAGMVDDDLAGQIITDDTAMCHLVWERETAAAKAYREWLAASVVLPYFVEAVRDIDTDELAESKTDTPTTLRMQGGN